MIRFVQISMMKSFFSKYKFHFFLVLIGVSIITVVDGLLHLNQQNTIYPDSEGYFEAARNLYVLHIGHNYRPMLMAAINGIPYLFGSSDAFIYEFAFYVNLFCWLATALLLFEILKNFVSGKAAFLLAVGSFLFVGTIALMHHLLSENIYTLFIVLAFYFLLRYYKSQSFWALSMALSLLVVSMLVRPGSKWLAVLFLIFYLKEWYRFYKSKAASLLYGSLCLVLVQCAGIKYQFGNFTISYIDSVTYYNYLGSKAVALRDGSEFSDVKKQRGNYIYSFYINGKKIKETAFNDALEQIKSNKTNLFKAYFLNLFENCTTGNVVIEDIRDSYNEPNHSYSMADNFLKLSQWQNIFFTVIGVLSSLYFFIRRRKNELFFSGVSFFVLYVIFLSAISSEQGDRFHLVVYPFVLILVGKLFFGRAPRMEFFQL